MGTLVNGRNQWMKLEISLMRINKANSINDGYSEYNNYKKKLKEKLKKDIPFDVHWDFLFKLEGKSIQYSNKPPVPNRARAVGFLEGDGRGFQYTYYAIETLMKESNGNGCFLGDFR